MLPMIYPIIRLGCGKPMTSPMVSRRNMIQMYGGVSTSMFPTFACRRVETIKWDMFAAYVKVLENHGKMGKPFGEPWENGEIHRKAQGEMEMYPAR